MASIESQYDDHSQLDPESQTVLPSAAPGQRTRSSQAPNSLDPPSDEYPPAHSREQSEGVMQSPNLPELPKHELEFSFDSLLNNNSGDFVSGPEVERVQKRASNVLKLAQENEKLNAELKAMTERLEAAERKRKELEQRAKKSSGNTSS